MSTDSQSDNQIDEGNPYKTTQPLSEGLLQVFEPKLKHVRTQLKELTEKGTTLSQQLHEENLSLAKTQHCLDIHEMLNTIEVYQTKLTNIKKDMRFLHDKSIKLKKRALKIQQVREKQEYVKQQRQLELKLEEELIPKAN